MQNAARAKKGRSRRWFKNAPRSKKDQQKDAHLTNEDSEPGNKPKNEVLAAPAPYPTPQGSLDLFRSLVNVNHSSLPKLNPGGVADTPVLITIAEGKVVSMKSVKEDDFQDAFNSYMKGPALETIDEDQEANFITLSNYDINEDSKDMRDEDIKRTNVYGSANVDRVRRFGNGSALVDPSKETNYIKDTLEHIKRTAGQGSVKQDKNRACGHGSANVDRDRNFGHGSANKDPSKETCVGRQNLEDDDGTNGNGSANVDRDRKYGHGSADEDPPKETCVGRENLGNDERTNGYGSARDDPNQANHQGNGNGSASVDPSGTCVGRPDYDSMWAATAIDNTADPGDNDKEDYPKNDTKKTSVDSGHEDQDNPDSGEDNKSSNQATWIGFASGWSKNLMRVS